MLELKIDPEFAAHLRALTEEEHKLLRESLGKDGCLTPIQVWQEHTDTIIDGHHRHEICQELGIPFKTKGLSFKDRAAVIEYIQSHQIGRRNLTPEQVSYFRGREYNRLKQSKGGQVPKKGVGQNGPPVSTAKQLADKDAVGESTVKRNAKFAQKLDALPAGERAEILSGRRKLKRQARTKKDQPVSSRAASNGAPRTPDEKIDRLDAQLLALEKARQGLRGVLNTSLMLIPLDRLEQAHTRAKAIQRSVGLDCKTLAIAVKKAQAKAKKTASEKPAKKQKTKPTTASGPIVHAVAGSKVAQAKAEAKQPSRAGVPTG
jgi:hypothetical protein